MSFDQSKRRSTFVLYFDEDFPGLEVHCRQPGYRPLRTLAQAVLALGDDLDGRGMSGDAKLEALEPLFSAFAQCVRRWNLVDEGRAVPLTELLDQDWQFLLVLARAWYRQVVPGQRPRAVDYAQAGDSSVDEQDGVTDVELPGEPGAGDEDGSVPPSPWGEPGTDEEWLGQFATKTMPEHPEEPDVDPATNEPPAPREPDPAEIP